MVSPNKDSHHTDNLEVTIRPVGDRLDAAYDTNGWTLIFAVRFSNWNTSIQYSPPDISGGLVAFLQRGTWLYTEDYDSSETMVSVKQGSLQKRSTLAPQSPRIVPVCTYVGRWNSQSFYSPTAGQGSRSIRTGLSRGISHGKAHTSGRIKQVIIVHASQIRMVR